MSWLEDTEYHRKRQVAQMAKAFGDSGTYFQKAMIMNFPKKMLSKQRKRKAVNQTCTKCVC